MREFYVAVDKAVADVIQPTLVEIKGVVPMGGLVVVEVKLQSGRKSIFDKLHHQLRYGELICMTFNRKCARYANLVVRFSHCMESNKKPKEMCEKSFQSQYGEQIA